MHGSKSVKISENTHVLYFLFLIIIKKKYIIDLT